MQGKAVIAKYSVSFCLPFLLGTLSLPELLIGDLEEELQQLLKELNRERKKGEWDMRIGAIE